MLTAARKVYGVSQALIRRGEPGTAYQIAGMLGVAPSTVTRWSAGAEPRGKHAVALDMLHRTLVKAEAGNADGVADVLYAIVIVMLSDDRGYLCLAIDGNKITAKGFADPAHQFGRDHGTTGDGDFY